MEFANALQAYLVGGGRRDAEWDSALRTMVLLLNPMAPHIGEDRWARIGGKGLVGDAAWPQYDPAAAAEPEATLVIQVAGKVRDRATVPAGTTEAQALEVAAKRE